MWPLKKWIKFDGVPERLELKLRALMHKGKYTARDASCGSGMAFKFPTIKVRVKCKLMSEMVGQHYDILRKKVTRPNTEFALTRLEKLDTKHLKRTIKTGISTL